MTRVRVVMLVAALLTLTPSGPAAAQTIRITPASDSPRQMVFHRPAGPFRVLNYTILELVRFAYQLPPEHVIGVPAWATTERFDAEWQWNEDPTAGEVQEMVKNLLALQFGLTTHIEQRPLPTYALVRAGGSLGPQLRLSSTDCRTAVPTGVLGVTPCQLRSGDRGLYMSGVTMAQVASEFGASSYLRLDRPVVDRTDLMGRFDLEFSLVTMRTFSDQPGRREMMRSDLPLPTLLERELGLTLREQESPLDVLVIDRVSRPVTR